MSFFFCCFENHLSKNGVFFFNASALKCLVKNVPTTRMGSFAATFVIYIDWFPFVASRGKWSSRSDEKRQIAAPVLSSRLINSRMKADRGEVQVEIGVVDGLALVIKYVKEFDYTFDGREFASKDADYGRFPVLYCGRRRRLSIIWYHFIFYRGSQCWCLFACEDVLRIDASIERMESWSGVDFGVRNVYTSVHIYIRPRPMDSSIKWESSAPVFMWQVQQIWIRIQRLIVVKFE